MKQRLLPVLALALLSGCSLLPGRELPGEPAAAAPASEPAAAVEPAAPVPPKLPAIALTPGLLQRLLLAEIAGQRGDLPLSAEIYRVLAHETRDPRIARRAAEIALHSRRTDVALEVTRLWLELEPSSEPARQTLMRLLAAQGQYDELGGMLAALLIAEPQNVGRNLTHLNRLFARGGDRRAILALVDTVTQPYLQYAEAHYARAQAALEARELVAARNHIERARALKPDWEAAALLHVQLIDNRAAAMATLGEFVAAQPQAREARLAYARALVNDKRYAEARREFGALLEQSPASTPQHGDIVFAVAVLSLQLKDTAAAEKHLRQLVDIGHAEADKARLYLGQIAEEGKRWDEALQWFDAVGRGEHYLPARLHGASVLARQGRLGDARRHLAAGEDASLQERVQLLLGEAQLLREADQLAEAHAVLVAGLTRHPDQPELLYETALLAEKLGRNDELERRLRRLIEVKPDHAHALNALGYSLADRNERLAEARELIERALELAPNDPYILDSKGWLLFRLGQSAAALETLNRAYGLRPDPEIAAHLGEVLWALGRRDEARATWDKARRDHPANETLAETIKRFPR